MRKLIVSTRQQPPWGGRSHARRADAADLATAFSLLTSGKRSSVGRETIGWVRASPQVSDIARATRCRRPLMPHVALLLTSGHTALGPLVWVSVPPHLVCESRVVRRQSRGDVVVDVFGLVLAELGSGVEAVNAQT